MTGFPILDVVIGLTFIYLLLALVCTTLMEWIAHVRNLRGRMLEQGTRRLLGEDGEKDAKFTAALFQHTLMQDLSEGKRKPSYVPSKTFARALRDIVRERQTATDAQQIPPRLQASLQALASSEPTQTDSQSLPAIPALAEWFDEAMDRLSGTYKRKTRWIVLLLAVGVTLLMNADTVKLTTNLWHNPTLRAFLVERAKVRLDQGPPLETVEYADPLNPQVTAPIGTDSTRSPDQLLAEEQALLGELFGWKAERAAFAAQGAGLWLFRHILGWTLTALAVSLGAPFWFSALDRFMKLRATGVVPPKYQAAPGSKPA